MRGLACVLMFQTHCYDAWLGGDARHTSFLQRVAEARHAPRAALPLSRRHFIRPGHRQAHSQKSQPRPDNPHHGPPRRRNLGLRPALPPAGVSHCLGLGSVDRSVSRRHPQHYRPLDDLDGAALRTGSLDSAGKRSASIVAMPHAIVPPSHSLLLSRSLAIALLTPPLYTTWRPTWLPWQLESYINGCHNLGAPQPWLFPMFPWTAFAFAGLAAGFILFSDWGRERTAAILAVFAAIGAAAILLSHSSSITRHLQLYRVYDYWHTSPNFL